MDLDRLNELGFEKSSKWKTVILIVSFSMWWNLFIVTQCYAVTLICTFELAFREENSYAHTYVMYIVYFIDVCYLFEVIFTVAYRYNSNYRKLKYSKGRPWFLIWVDVISLIPLELLYAFHYVVDNKSFHVRLYFLQNRSLRIYRIFQVESLYGIIVRKSSQYAVFMFLQFTTKAFLISHIMCCIWAQLDHSVLCNEQQCDCKVWCETHMAILLILNWSGPRKMFGNPWERVVVSLTLLIGFVLIYTYFYPYTLYVCMQLNAKKAQYYDKYLKLEYFLRNMVHNADLKEEVLRAFNDIWRKDKIDFELETLLDNIPLSLRKEIFTDVYWEAFRHSGLLRGISRSCKRSMALRMQTVSFHTGEVIWAKEKTKFQMMFLVQGIVQIMAEENVESPVLSFSSGTVFGELSLFLLCRSQALVKCKSYCELQILKMRDAITVFKDYPTDSKIFITNFEQRLAMARYTQWRKEKFLLERNLGVLESETSENSVQDCVKWLKMQWRATWEGHKRHLLYIRAMEEGFRIPAWSRQMRPEIKVDFISNYLDLFVLSDVFEEKKDVVCLRTSFPWSIDPSTQFLKIWKIVIRFVAIFVAVSYPLCTSWVKHFPWPIYLLSYPITMMYIIDVMLQLMTAIKTKNIIVTKFWSVLRWKLQSPTFYLDLLAAFPYQLYILLYVNVHKVKSYHIGLILHPAIFKSHVFLRMDVPLNSYMDKTIIIKNGLIFLFMVYLFAEIIQLAEVRDLINPVEKDWLTRIIEGQLHKEVLRNYLAAGFRAWATALGIPDYTTYPDEGPILIAFCVARYTFFFFFCFFMGDFYSKYTMKIFSAETFEVLLKRIKRFFESIYIPPKIMKQLLKTLRFQWQYDLADHLSSNVPIIKSIPYDLRKNIYYETTYKTLRACRMFKEESVEFIKDVMARSSLVAVPTGSVLVTYGHTSHAVSILHRGYCQLDSFMIKDISAGLGKPILIGPGNMFPLLSSFCNTPAPISVISVTDCEVIMINLEDLITITIKHNFFRDIVEVVMRNRFLEAVKFSKPALVRLDMMGKTAEPKNQFIKYIYCSYISRLLCLSRYINMKVIQNWELFYHITLLFFCTLWPCCFGILIYFSHILIPALSFMNIILLYYIVVQFCFPYYNKDGLLVTHPKKTSIHYLKTNFFIDVFSLTPIYPIYVYFIRNPYGPNKFAVALLCCIQNYLKILHILSFVNHLNFLESRRYLTRLVKMILLVFSTLNILVNFSMHYNVTWIYSAPYTIVGYDILLPYKKKAENILDTNNVVHLYFYFCYVILCNLMTTNYTFHSRPGVKLYLSVTESFIGTVIILYLYAWMSSNSMFANVGGTIFQERIRAFVKYLEFEKADDRLIDRAIAHYNHEWSETQGESLKTIFEHLPIHLHEELAYPLYRPTIARNEVFAGADEGFFKIMSMHVTNVYFNRGSVIIFQDESQSDIYFVHKGKCFVYDWFLILDVGSIVGDIKRKGLMENKVYALTHVEMLKISSNDFYMILNNFYDLEAHFIYKTKNAENYIKSQMSGADFQLRPVDSRDVLKAFGLQDKDIGFEDHSFFEDPENSYISLMKQWKARPEEKIRFMIIYPGTWKMACFQGMYAMVTILTLLIVPTQISFGALTTETFTAIAILDFFWLLYILLNFRVGYLDKTKGDIVTNAKFIAKAYIKRKDGLFLDFLALFPFELIPLILIESRENVNASAVAWLRFLRLLRGINLFKTLRTETRKLNSKGTVKYMKIVLYIIVWFVVLVNVYFFIATDEFLVNARNPYKLELEQLWALIFVSEHVLNLVTSANMYILMPESISQIVYFNIMIFLCPYAKGWLISQVLSILYVNGLATAYYKSQVLSLEMFLKNQDTSPSIVKEVLNYKLNLLLFGRSENMPHFLKESPPSLRISLMKDLYLHHLTECPLFKDVDHVFLHQLVARMTREIYFPGQKIVEQSDVDHQMFFIHSGEIYVINHTKERAYVEYVVGKMYAGEYFGEAQGLWFSLPHSNTYRARTQAEVLILHSDDWMDLRRNFPTIALQVLEKAKALRIF